MYVSCVCVSCGCCQMARTLGLRGSERRGLVALPSFPSHLPSHHTLPQVNPFIQPQECSQVTRLPISITSFKNAHFHSLKLLLFHCVSIFMWCLWTKKLLAQKGGRMHTEKVKENGTRFMMRTSFLQDRTLTRMHTSLGQFTETIFPYTLKENALAPKPLNLLPRLFSPTVFS